MLTNPTPAGRAELLRVVQGALNGAPLTLAQDALTRDSVLIIDRTERRDAEGRRLVGREMGRPERFQLFKSGSRCILVHERTGQRRELTSVTCAPRPAPGG